MGTKKPSGGGGGSSSLIRAGQAVFEIFAKDNVSKVVDRIVAKVKGMGQALSRAGSMGMGAGAALGAGPLGLLLGGGSRLADVARLSRQFEVPIQLMGKFAHAAKLAGVSVDEVMNDTRGRFSDLVNQAPLIDPAQAEAALQIQNDFTEAVESLQDAMAPLLKTLSPLVAKTSEFVQHNAGGVKVLAAAAGGVFALGLAAKVTGISLASLAGIVPLAFGALASPVGVAAAAVGGLTAAFLTMTDTGRGMLPDLGKGFARLGDGFTEFTGTVKTGWAGVLGALKAGDFGTALKVAFTGLKLEWAKVTVFWEQAWHDFKWGFLKDLHDIAVKIEESGIWRAAKWVGDKTAAAGKAWWEMAAPVADMMGDSIRDIEATAARAGGGTPDGILGMVLGAVPAEAPKEVMVDPLQLAIDNRRAEIAKMEEEFRELAAAAAGKGAAAPGWFGDGGMFDDVVQRLRGQGALTELAEGLMGGAAQGATARAAARGMDEVRGGFNVASALSQFGFGSKVGDTTELMKQQIALQKAQVAELKGLPDAMEIGDAVLQALTLQ